MVVSCLSANAGLRLPCSRVASATPGKTMWPRSRVRLRKRLGCRVTINSAQALGVFDCAAANEPGFQVRAAVYAVDVEGVIEPAAEIDQVVWVDPLELPDLPFAPLTRDHVLPLARMRP